MRALSFRLCPSAVPKETAGGFYLVGWIKFFGSGHREDAEAGGNGPDLRGLCRKKIEFHKISENKRK